MRIALTSDERTAIRSDAVILFAWADGKGRPFGASDDSKKLGRMLDAWSKSARFRAHPGEVTQFPTWGALPCEQVIVAGLGTRADFHLGVLRRTLGASVRRAVRMGAHRVTIAWHALEEVRALELQDLGRALASTLHRSLYGTGRDGESADQRPPSFMLYVKTSAARQRALKAAAAEGVVVGDAVNRVRRLANMPGNEATPDVVAAFARRMAARHGLKCEIWNRRKLAQEHCRALLAVAQGSRHEPRMVILRYPGRKKKAAPLVLVGKTITFDTGGISIKPARGMEWMRYDKSGGMAVLAAMAMAARLKPDRPVIGILAIAENMPGGNATRPGDVVRSRSGRTIEIINTDAEGRLVLADALHVALDFKPAAIMDLATLTGAAVTAVGHVVSAVMGHSGQIERVMRAGERTGDRVWPLPLYREYQEMLKTPFADIKNTGDGTAGAIAGGMFLSRFVPPALPWVHVDLTHAWEEKEQSFSAAGANLFGAELAWEWVKTFDH